MKEEEIFFRLLRTALGTGTAEGLRLTGKEWAGMAELAQKQALGGILMQAIEKLPPDSRPPKPLLLQWIGWTKNIESVNRQLNNEAVAVSLYFKEKGYRSMILKGQGVAQFYPRPLWRMPGDIDIWVDAPRRELARLARSADPKAEMVYHHIDMSGLAAHFPVEVHTTPSWMNSPLTNARLQRMFRQWKDTGFGTETALPDTDGSVRTPTLEMNRIYLLVHIYRHLMTEGIGLKQLMDYYCVMRLEMDATEKKTFTEQVHRLRMERFASAVMHVLGKVFGLERQRMPVAPSEKYGERLLEEIMRAGNFGQYDPRIRHDRLDTEGGRFYERMRRIARFVKDYPDEACWSPYFKLWHFFWRLRHNNGRP